MKGRYRVNDATGEIEKVSTLERDPGLVPCPCKCGRMVSSEHEDAQEDRIGLYL